MTDRQHQESDARPRFFPFWQERPGWYVVSRYAEEDIVEAICDDEEAARALIPVIRAARGDQNEAPTIVVEDHR